MELLIIFYSLSVNLAYLHTTDLLVSNENIRKAVVVSKLFNIKESIVRVDEYPRVRLIKFQYKLH